MAREKCRQMDDSFMISNATQPTPHSPTPLREISARIRNMEMTARALRQDSGRALKISTAPQSAKAKFSQGRSVKRVVRTGRGRDARGCSLDGNTLFQLHHKIRFNILSIFLSLCTFFHSTTHSLSSYLPLSLSPCSASFLIFAIPPLLSVCLLAWQNNFRLLRGPGTFHSRQ